LATGGRLTAMVLFVQRGEHNIEHELVFTNHNGYIFHDSRGFEAGDNKELEIVQDFVRRRSLARRLNDRLHAIWFVFVSLDIYVRKFTLSGIAFRWTTIGHRWT
jgi:hypothetical protein